MLEPMSTGLHVVFQNGIKDAATETNWFDSRPSGNPVGGAGDVTRLTTTDSLVGKSVLGIKRRICLSD